jgi:hypothetical protein
LIEHTRQIEDLWSSQIGDDQARMDLLGARAGRLKAQTKGGLFISVTQS